MSEHQESSYLHERKTGSWTFLGSYRFLMRILKRFLPGRLLRANSRHNAPAVAPDPAVADLSRKLWAGFSQHARKDLHEVVRATSVSAQRMLAAWELAKFHAVEAQWDQSLYYLRVINEMDETFLRSKDAGPLYVEALLAGQQFDEAEQYAGHMIDKGAFGTDYYCALSNVFATRAVQQKVTADLQLTRLALLNSLYKDANLAEVDLVDPSRGFVFGNLAVAEERLSYVNRPEAISVLMTVFNAEQSVSIAVSSILSQTWRNVELVVVDDASRDGSWELIERLATKDRRIIHVRNAMNMGLYQARNRALSLVTGDYVMVYGSHHWSHPQMLHAQVQAMHADPDLKLSFPGMASVSPDMKYSLELSRDDTQYVYRSSQSYLIKRPNLQHLDKWDGVTENADEEFIRRAGAIWGDHSLRDVLPNAPLALCLKRLPPLGLRGEPDRQSLTCGASQEYLKQAEFWRKKVLLPAESAGHSVPFERVSTKQPFPIPNKLAPRNWPRNQHYNLIIISDLTLLGGTRRCNEGYIAAATNLGMKVGLLHWARYDLKLADDVATEYRILSYSENVDILTADERVSADLVVIHHPPIMKCLPYAVPRIDTKRLAVLVNQLPQRFGEPGNAYYQRRDVEADCLRLFGLLPVWIPISPLVRRVLLDSGFAPLARENWIPPLGKIVLVDGNTRALGARRRRKPVIGRHSRDHVTKWPGVEKDLRAAYCADSELQVRFLGGARSARKVLTRWPRNWEELAFDSMTVSDFLNDLDFLVHFTHSAYVEEFGRNIMEAMAAGMPAVVPPHFKEVFGDAACYAEPEQVEDLIRTLWYAESAYVEQVEKGFHFVREFASTERVERRLQQAIQGTI